MLREHGDYTRLTGSGRLAILNNAIELAVILLLMLMLMLMAAIFSGAGALAEPGILLTRRWRNPVE